MFLGFFLPQIYAILPKLQRKSSKNVPFEPF